MEFKTKEIKEIVDKYNRTPYLERNYDATFKEIKDVGGYYKAYLSSGTGYVPVAIIGESKEFFMYILINQHFLGVDRKKKENFYDFTSEEFSEISSIEEQERILRNKKREISRNKRLITFL